MDSVRRMGWTYNGKRDGLGVTDLCSNQIYLPKNKIFLKFRSPDPSYPKFPHLKIGNNTIFYLKSWRDERRQCMRGHGTNAWCNFGQIWLLLRNEYWGPVVIRQSGLQKPSAIVHSHVCSALMVSCQVASSSLLMSWVQLKSIQAFLHHQAGHLQSWLRLAILQSQRIRLTVLTTLDQSLFFTNSQQGDWLEIWWRLSSGEKTQIFQFKLWLVIFFFVQARSYHWPGGLLLMVLWLFHNLGGYFCVNILSYVKKTMFSNLYFK